MIHTVLLGWGIVAVAMVIMWLRQLRTQDATSVDVAWAFGLGFLAVFYRQFAGGDGTRALIVAVMAAIWALRLAIYLLRDRVLRRAGEDGRYKYLRGYWGTRAPVGFFFFYQAQALFAVLFSLPIIAAMQGPALTPLAWSGVLVWVIAVAGETIADRQLARFRADRNNRGTVCEHGLWKYSRHPNYFFEWLHWWAYVFFAVGSVYWWISLAGPVLMLLFLLLITGIPATEAQAVASRGDAYRRYQRTTSAFIPWFPNDDAP